jgi:hypothetical protein
MNMKNTILLLALLFSGCCPVLYTKHPGFSGRILYSQTQAPVEGAEITLKQFRYYGESGSTNNYSTNCIVAKTTTDERGLFYINDPKSLGIYIAPMDIFPCHYKLNMIFNGKEIGLHESYHRALGDTHFYELNEIFFEPDNGEVRETPAKN